MKLISKPKPVSFLRQRKASLKLHARQIATIQKVFSDYYGERFDLTRTDRLEPYVTIRQLCMLLCRELTKASFTEIANAFGNKYHKTTMHACQSVRAKMAKDEGECSLSAEHLAWQMREDYKAVRVLSADKLKAHGS